MTTSHIAVHLEDNEYMKSMPDNWYSSDYYAEKTVEYLKDRDMSKPFFSYLPFTAPHWPLQAPPELIKHYRGVYKDGPDALRQSRLNRMIELGLMDADTVPHPIVGDEEAEWADMSPETKAKSSRAMEAFAGMVEVRTNQQIMCKNMLMLPSQSILMLERFWMNSRNKANLIIPS